MTSPHRREIILDVETTGLSVEEGHRIIEIGCVELYDKIPTGNVFQTYINPEREIDKAAQNIHGISLEFLYDKPVFEDIADSFMDFIQESPLVIHNASFDIKFLNAELLRLGRKILLMQRVVDTLWIARKQYPRAKNSLDALCSRFRVDVSKRHHHGALLDAELLAQVYVVLCSGRQVALTFNKVVGKGGVEQSVPVFVENRMLNHRPSKEELEAHKAFLQKIPDNVWDNL